MNLYTVETDRIRLEIKPAPGLDPEGQRWVRVDIFKREWDNDRQHDTLRFLDFDTMPLKALQKLERQIRTACDILEEGR